MRWTLNILALVSLITWFKPGWQTQSVSLPKVTFDSLPAINTFGVKLNVTDMTRAIDFYCYRLGYKLVQASPDSTFVSLSYPGATTKLFLHKVRNLLPERLEDAHPSFSMQVNNLDSTIMKLKVLNVEFAEKEKRKEGVGYAIYIRDPFGKLISLLQQTIVKTESFIEPRIYNYGFYISNMDTARDFYCNRLGFRSISDRYLPYDIPLAANKTFAFMLHYREMVEPIKNRSSDFQHTVIIFKSSDIESAVKELTGRGIRVDKKGIQKTPLGKSISFTDPFGIVSEIVDAN